MFRATHNLIAKTSGHKTPVFLTPASQAGHFVVFMAVDSSSNSSMIEYHLHRGIVCQGLPLVNYSLEPIQTLS